MTRVRDAGQDPYRMLIFTSWNPTDRAGLTIGIARNDKRRLVAAVQAGCDRRLASGHTYVWQAGLPILVRGLLGCDADQAATDRMGRKCVTCRCDMSLRKPLSER